MKISELIAKALRREELNALERAELEQCDPDALKEKLDELERSRMSREEALQQDLAAANAERDALRSERDRLVRRERIAAIAAEAGCTEPEYLDFLASRRAVALEDEDAVKSFVAEVERENPHCFRSRLRSGSGASRDAARPEATRSAAGAGTPDRIGEIVAALGGAPDAHLE